MTGRGRGRGDRGARGGGGIDRGRGGGGVDRGRGTADRGRGGGGDRGRGGPAGDRGGGRGQGPRGGPGGGGGGGRGDFRGRGGPPGGGGGGGGPPVQGAAQDTNYNVSTVAIRAPAVGEKRPSFGTSGRVIEVVTNCFKCEIPSSWIFHYDVSFVSKSPLPQRATMKIIRAMQDQYANIFTSKGGYDGRANFYGPIEYSFGEAQEFHVNYAGRTYPVRLKLARKINPQNLRRYIDAEMAHDENVLTAINACNVVIRAQPLQDNPFNSRSFFTRAEYRALGKGIELWRGYFQSVRPAIGRMVINVDISSATVYKAGPLIDLCLEYLGVPPGSNPTPHLNARMPARKKNDLLKFIRNVDVKTEKKDDVRVRAIKDFSTVGADSHTFTNEGAQTTIAAYYSMATGRPLRYPTLLSVKLSKQAFVPLERCMVVPGQLMRKQIPQEMMKDVLGFSTMNPESRLRSIMNGLQVLQYGSSPYLRDFGINVTATPMQIQGRILETPTLQYGGNKSVRPANGMWNMRDLKLYKPAVIKGCVIIIYDRAFRKESEDNLKQGLFEACRAVGISGMPNGSDVPVLRCDPAGRFSDHIREAGQAHVKAKKVPPNLVVVVLPDFGSEDIYVGVKHAGDILIGVATQCLKGSKCWKTPNHQYFANVCLKINAKLGGVNVIPKADTVRFLLDPSNPTLILGADVMHPGPGVGARPSFAAVTGNVDSETSKYVAISKAQKPRQEMIEELDKMVEHVLRMYINYRRSVEQKPNPAPKRIIFYRDGISEGQFKECKDFEVKKIREACKRVGISMPALTVIVVGKRHHVRFFPVNRGDADKSGNAPAGLVVDRDITSPVEFDFYLQSHGGLLGTSRSAHYNVLVDENRFTPDELQKLSFSLCHVYARATRSVSIVPPVYYADIVCARAKHHYDPDGAQFTETGTQASGTDADAQLQEFQQRFRPLHNATSQVMYFQ